MLPTRSKTIWRSRRGARGTARLDTYAIVDAIAEVLPTAVPDPIAKMFLAQLLYVDTELGWGHRSHRDKSSPDRSFTDEHPLSASSPCIDRRPRR